MNDDNLVYFDRLGECPACIIALTKDGLMYYTKTDESSQPDVHWKLVHMNEDAIKLVH